MIIQINSKAQDFILYTDENYCKDIENNRVPHTIKKDIKDVSSLPGFVRELYRTYDSVTLHGFLSYNEYKIKNLEEFDICCKNTPYSTSGLVKSSEIHQEEKSYLSPEDFMSKDPIDIYIGDLKKRDNIVSKSQLNQTFEIIKPKLDRYFIFLYSCKNISPYTYDFFASKNQLEMGNLVSCIIQETKEDFPDSNFKKLKLLKKNKAFIKLQDFPTRWFHTQSIYPVEKNQFLSEENPVFLDKVSDPKNIINMEICYPVKEDNNIQVQVLLGFSKTSCPIQKLKKYSCCPLLIKEIDSLLYFENKRNIIKKTKMGLCFEDAQNLKSYNLHMCVLLKHYKDTCNREFIFTLDMGIAPFLDISKINKHFYKISSMNSYFHENKNMINNEKKEEIFFLTLKNILLYCLNHQISVLNKESMIEIVKDKKNINLTKIYFSFIEAIRMFDLLLIYSIKEEFIPIMSCFSPIPKLLYSIITKEIKGTTEISEETRQNILLHKKKYANQNSNLLSSHLFELIDDFFNENPIIKKHEVNKEYIERCKEEHNVVVLDWIQTPTIWRQTSLFFSSMFNKVSLWFKRDK